MNLFLHGVEDFQVVRGDTLRNPAFFEGDRLATFDCVIANPPFSLEKWGEDMWPSDPSAATLPACHPQPAVTTPGCSTWSSRWPRSGRMAVVLPQGALFRKGAEGASAQKLLEMDLVEAVIGLGPNLFYGTGLAACILVLRQRKPAKHKKQGADRRCVAPVPQGACAELSGARARRRDPRLVSRLRRRAGRGPRGHSGRDHSERLEAEHPALRRAALRGGHPTVPDAIAAFKDALARCREAEERLAQVMTEGGWLK